MDDPASSKQASNPVEKVNQLLDELVATTESSQAQASDRRHKRHALLKAVSNA
jgi:hypothetical protein